MADRHPAAAHRFGPRYLRVLGSAVLCYAALGAVLRDVPFYVEHQLGGTAFEVGLVVGAPSLAWAILRPVGGRLADRSGPVMVLMDGALVMSVGVVPAFAKNVPALRTSRLLLGAGPWSAGAGIHPGGISGRGGGDIFRVLRRRSRDRRSGGRWSGGRL
jgi:MFS family permease